MLKNWNIYKYGSRLHYLCAILLFILSFVIFQNYYLPAKAEREKVIAQEQKLQNEITDLEKKLSVLEIKCEELKSNEPETVERVIREEFGWGKSNEVLITTSKDIE